MADSYYYENRTNAGPNKDEAWWTKIKLIDNGDGTFSLGCASPPLKFKNIAGAATTLIKSGAGTLARIIINKPVALSVITLYDALSATGTKIATLTNPLNLLQQQTTLEFNLSFDNGLTIVTSAADDITVVYR